jgi:acetyl-CoA carboxylase biotin carboxyl carrier protein
MNTDFSQVEKLAKLMAEYDLSEINIDEENGKLRIRRGNGGDAEMVPQYFAAPQAAAPAAPVAASTPAPAAEAPIGEAITAPIVGTFYEAPAPDAGPFVKVGDTVTADTVVCIIEAMKVMNEVKAERSGVIKKVLVENARAVEYGQPLFEITPA